MNSWFAGRPDSAGNFLSSDFTFLADTPGITADAALAVVVAILLRRAQLAVMLLNYLLSIGMQQSWLLLPIYKSWKCRTITT